jgi:ribosomal protein S12 methylthiotransferase
MKLWSGTGIDSVSGHIEYEKARRSRAFYIITLGCSKNQCDAERLNGALISAGLESAASPDSARFIIVNTCGFINDAKKESIGVILDSLDLKEDNPDTQVIVAGCLSKRYYDDLRKDMPEVDLVWGISDDSLVGELISRAGIDAAAKLEDGGRVPFEKNIPFEYIKIADGCSNNCSYCAIPLIRGAHHSFSPEAVLADARSAVSRGVKELVVVAQDIAAYDYNGVRLPELLRALAHTGAPWIRLLYCHPDHLTDDIIEAIRDIPQIVPYIDIPFQHVSRDIVAAMNRKGDAGTYLSLVRRLREAVPGIAIRSTFMTGFPGETDEQFEELLDFLTEARLDRVGAFTYSPEEGTKASAMSGEVPEKKKRARYERLMAMQKRISAAKLSEKIGTTVRVLVEEDTGNGTWIGRTEFDAPEVDGVFFLTGSGIALHDIVTAKVNDAVEYDLEGSL